MSNLKKDTIVDIVDDIFIEEEEEDFGPPLTEAQLIAEFELEVFVNRETKEKFKLTGVEKRLTPVGYMYYVRLDPLVKSRFDSDFIIVDVGSIPEFFSVEAEDPSIMDSLI